MGDGLVRAKTHFIELDGFPCQCKLNSLRGSVRLIASVLDAVEQIAPEIRHLMRAASIVGELHSEDCNQGTRQESMRPVSVSEYVQAVYRIDLLSKLLWSHCS